MTQVSQMMDMREASKNRTPREFFQTVPALIAAMENEVPPLGLAQDEVDALIGTPGTHVDPESGEWVGYVPAVRGAGNYCRNQYFHYTQQSGAVLVYDYEGALAYALQRIVMSDA